MKLGPVKPNFFSLAMRSPTLGAATSLVAVGVFGALRYAGKISPKTFYFALGGAGLLLSASLYNWKKLKFEVTLKYTDITTPKNAWYSKIPLTDTDGKLYLGAMPIEGREFPSDVDHVISVCEIFEFYSTPLNTILIPDSLDHYESPDFLPVSEYYLDLAADHIKTKLAEGKKIYIHCKAGRGRSAMCVLAYLIKYKEMSYDDALALVKKARPQINMNAADRKSVV